VKENTFLYINKGNLATPIDEQASINTPEESSGTVSKKILSQTQKSVNLKAENSEAFS